MLLYLLIFLLVSNAMTSRRDKSILYSRVVMQSLFAASFLACDGLYLTSLEKGIGIYGGLFHVNVFTQSFNIFMLLMSAVMLMMTGFYPRSVYVKSIYSSVKKLFTKKLSYNKKLMSDKNGEQFSIIEYGLMIVFILCGALFLVSTGDLMSMFLCMELQSYGLYMLSTLYRDSESSTASGLTYFLLGGLSSCFILLGSAFLYSNSGTTNLDNIYIMYSMYETGSGWYNTFFMDLGLVMMLVGFLFKMSAAPFHFWSPDVYDGVPTVVTTYIAMVPKMSMMGLFIDLTSHMESLSSSWKIMFMLSSLLSFIMGSVLGLTQYSMKSLFAYSTMSHVGFLLLGLCTDSVESLQACMFYLLQYSVSNLNIFLIMLSMGYLLYLYIMESDSNKTMPSEELIDQNNSPMQLITQMKGYFYTNAFLSLSLAMTLFSFMGMPPMAGFFAKQMMLSAALDKNFIFLSMVAMLTSVMGAAYYLNLMKQIFFYNSDYKKNPSTENIQLTGYMMNNNSEMDKDNMAGNSEESFIFTPENMTMNSGISSVMSVCSLVLLLFMFVPETWFNVASMLTMTLFK